MNQMKINRLSFSPHLATYPAWLIGSLALGLALVLSGCQGIMLQQPKYAPLEPSTFFADGRSARPIDPNTVSLGTNVENDVLYTGRTPDGELAQDIPIPVTPEFLQRGQEEFNIFCAPCHGLSGYGNGVIVQHGFPAPPSYHQDFLRQVPPGYIFDVISNGKGMMYAYNYRVAPEDRWAIVAYVRALQFSQLAPGDLLTPEDLQKLPGQ